LDKLNEVAPRFDKSRGPFKYAPKIRGPKFLAPKGVVKRYVERHEEFLAYLTEQFNVEFDAVDYDQFPERISYEFPDETLQSLAEILNKQSRKIAGTWRFRRAVAFQEIIDLARRKFRLR
jgi:hypothetical protein